MKKVAVLFLLVSFCLSVGRTWYWATDGFRLSRIEGFEGIGREREFSEEAEKALSQRYLYLARGRQCFAFLSEDGKYVLKFPRLDRYNDRILFHINPFRDSVDWRRKSHSLRKDKLFASFEISCDDLLEETALVALFNAPKTGKKVEIVDRLGRTVKLPLEKTGFILQRKLRLFQDVFQEAMDKRDEGEVSRILDRLIDVVIQIAKKGIISKDGSFLKNFGFDENRAYQIDVGSFYRMENLSDEEVFSLAMHASLETLRVWLLELNPSLLELIDQKLRPVYAGAT